MHIRLCERPHISSKVVREGEHIVMITHGPNIAYTSKMRQVSRHEVT